MTDNLGAIVALIPSSSGLPIHESVVGGEHVTLAYFGDNPVENILEVELIQLVSNIMDNWPDDIFLDVVGIEEFGPDQDAVVLALDDSVNSPAFKIRERIIDSISEELKHPFRISQTYLDYKPHITIGYKSEGFDPTVLESVGFPDRIHIRGASVWNGPSRTFVHNAGDSSLMHYGILRRSGRYPWGSGENPYQRSLAFYSAYNQLKAEGLNDTEIATLFGSQAGPGGPPFNTSSLRTTRSLAKDAKIAGEAALIRRLKEKRMSNTAISRRTGIPEPTVRERLKDSVAAKTNATAAVADKLREAITDTHYIDVGRGNANRLGISNERLASAVAILRDEGYELMTYKEYQPGTGHYTTIKFLTPPGSKGKVRISDYPERINILDARSEDNGASFVEKKPPTSVSSRRLAVAYAEDGGADRDGIIELRRGKKDLDLGANRYAQVRIAVDGTHYLKGMAYYNDDLPDGVDIRFNTNKTRKEAPNKLDTLKPLKIDKITGQLDLDAPFGAMIKLDGQRGALNIVNEEGDWADWSTKLSSQMLSKQPESLAKQQLDLTRDIRKAELDEIMSLTNPAVKQKLLETFANSADSNAVTLKAMALPRVANKVLLPVPNMKPTEVYAPTFKDGERVVLVRHPHGGRFEIPELTVNNRSRTAKGIMGDAIDAIGINPKVAAQLSGADFDGDTVLVIPQNGQLKRSDPLKQLEGFDARVMYPERPGMTYMSKHGTQQEMGRISNLITDMTIIGANNADLAAAVRHSMVVIDAEKHKLDYKQSEIDNGIKRLRETYQPEGGASTIISRAKSPRSVEQFRPARVGEGGPIDPKTGELRYVNTGATKRTWITDPKTGQKTPKLVRDAVTGELVEETKPVTQLVERMAYTRDARELMSSPTGKPMERVYATYANEMKGLANQARLALINTPNQVHSPSAARAYAPQVDSLVSQLNIALQNAPLERRAIIVANAITRAKMESNPDMDGDEVKKVSARALAEARLRTGANKTQIKITPLEWEAIQAGAISHNRLSQILNHTDIEDVKELATPRQTRGVPVGVLSRAQAMRNAGHTWSEIAGALGYSVSTLTRAVGK